MRVVAFAFLTPFFFLKGGMNVSAQRALGEPRRPRAALRREDGARSSSASTRSPGATPRRTRPSRRC